MSDEVKSGKPRMQLFKAEGTPLGPDMMRPEGLEGSVLAGFARAEEAGMHDGHRLRCLYRSPLPNGPSLCHMWLKSGFVTPRHKHDTNCIYYVLAGQLKLGNATAGPGEGLFVPEGTVYSIEAGPEGLEVLEFRTDTAFNVLYTGNDEANWDRIVGAVAGNAAGWAGQQPPSMVAAEPEG